MFPGDRDTRTSPQLDAGVVDGERLVASDAVLLYQQGDAAGPAEDVQRRAARPPSGQIAQRRTPVAVSTANTSGMASAPNSPQKNPSLATVDTGGALLVAGSVAAGGPNDVVESTRSARSVAGVVPPPADGSVAVGTLDRRQPVLHPDALATAMHTTATMARTGVTASRR